MIKEIKNLIKNKAFLFIFHKTMFVKLFFNGKLIKVPINTETLTSTFIFI